ncbi:hypothetical protein D3C87_832710 [compost metagenome]
MKEIVQKARVFVQMVRKFFVAEPIDEQTNIESGAYSQYNSPIDDAPNNFIEIASHYFPENYQLDEVLLKAANAVDDIYYPRYALYYLLSHSKKIDSPRQPLPVKKSYSYMIWQMFNPSEVNISATLPKHPRLVTICEETLELSAAKADILILSSGGEYFEVNHLLSKIDLTHKYVIICSVFDEDDIREYVLYRVDRIIYPDFSSEKECLSFIDEIIREATTNPLKA